MARSLLRQPKFLPQTVDPLPNRLLHLRARIRARFLQRLIGHIREDLERLFRIH